MTVKKKDGKDAAVVRVAHLLRDNITRAFIEGGPKVEIEGSLLGKSAAQIKEAIQKQLTKAEG